MHHPETPARQPDGQKIIHESTPFTRFPQANIGRIQSYPTIISRAPAIFVDSPTIHLFFPKHIYIYHLAHRNRRFSQLETSIDSGFSMAMLNNQMVNEIEIESWT
jgi:hypothetical protein